MNFSKLGAIFKKSIIKYTCKKFDDENVLIEGKKKENFEMARFVVPSIARKSEIKVNTAQRDTVSNYTTAR